jgi:hypothetical protein
MKKRTHIIYILSFWLIGITVAAYFIYYGFSYYKLPEEERFWSNLHNTLKPSGITGHGLGIIGSIMMIFGVVTYSARKRVRRFMRMGLLKHWLEFHIFLCTLGPVLILFHTAFKFGGIVAVSFWCMVFVVLSGVIGRFIYVQIPRSIRGDELTLKELNEQSDSLTENLRHQFKINGELVNKIDNIFFNPESKRSILPAFQFLFISYFSSITVLRKINVEKYNLNITDIDLFKRKLREKIIITRKIKTLRTAQRLFGYWHAVHLPFAIVMFVIMIIHIVAAVVFGYKWIF